MMSERSGMIKRALESYEFRLSDLVKSEGEANAVDSLLLDDIISNTGILRQAYTLVSACNLEKLVQEYRNEVCCALVTYMAGLESTKRSISEKLVGAKPRFDNIDREIDLVNQVKIELCK
jgi:hypothetical protein